VNFSFVDPWHLYLPREGGHVISFCGSGGKTSLLKAVAEIYAQADLPLVLTTTTRTEPLADTPATDLADLDPGTAPRRFFLRDGLDADGKWQGVTPAVVDGLGELFPDRLVLVEADGAAKHPLKLYREDEPVLPDRTSLALVVMGADAVGGFTRNVLHRHDRLDFPPLNGLTADAVVEWDHVHDLLTGPGGYLARIPEDIPVVLVLAGLGEVQDSIGLFGFVGRAMTHPRVRLVTFCETGPEDISFRTACRQDEDAAHDPDPT